MAALNRRTVVGRNFFRATAIAVFAAITVGGLASTAEAKPNNTCVSAIRYLNFVSQKIGMAEAAGDAREAAFWYSEYGASLDYASASCGW